MQASMVLELWDLFQEYVPSSKKAQAVQDIVDVFVNNGADERWFEDIIGEDEMIDEAIRQSLDLEEEPEDELDEDWEE